MGIIIINAISLSLVWVDMDPRIVQNTNFLQEVFNLIFMLECALKITAYKGQYFQCGWNKFDFFLVISGMFGLIFQNDFSNSFLVVRILRVGRLLRLLKKAKRLYVIFNSFLHTIPAFFNVGSLIFVTIYIFSAFGNKLFAEVKLNG